MTFPFLFFFNPLFPVVAYKLDFEDAHCFETTSTYIDFFVFSVHLQRANDDKKVVSQPPCGRAGQ